VKYNRNGLLAIWLTSEGIGAYPDSMTKYLILNIGTGDVLSIENLFETLKLAQLRNLIRRKMKAKKTP
jgi:hypothetical protein